MSAFSMSDAGKIKEGRGTYRKPGQKYIPWIKTRELSPHGVRTMIHDPIANRAVHTRSDGERIFFWLLRFDDDVVDIKEQVDMKPEVVNDICRAHGWKQPGRILSTDFVVMRRDLAITAYSIKQSRAVFQRESYKTVEEYNKLLQRTVIEKEYYERAGINLYLRFKDELPIHRSRNIAHIMQFYSCVEAVTREEKVMFLLARKVIAIDLDSGPVRFGEIAERLEGDIEGLYRKAVAEYGYEY